jgi:hypothetical protein
MSRFINYSLNKMFFIVMLFLLQDVSTSATNPINEDVTTSASIPTNKNAQTDDERAPVTITDSCRCQIRWQVLNFIVSYVICTEKQTKSNLSYLPSATILYVNDAIVNIEKKEKTNPLVVGWNWLRTLLI